MSCNSSLLVHNGWVTLGEGSMHAVTIDNLDIQTHNRYAHDQTILDPQFLEKPGMVSTHSDIASLSSIYASEFEKLFGLQNKNMPWAEFSPPAKTRIHKNRYFTHRLILGILGTEYDEQEDLFEEEEETEEMIEKAEGAKKKFFQRTKSFEKERSAIINVLSSIKELNKMLEECNARRLQYQKG